MNISINIGNVFIKVSCLLIISLPAFAEQSEQQTPMYNATDTSFMASAINSFGTREHASEGYVEHGFAHYSNNKFKKSMRRFNQAWLLEPDNPYAYAYPGFGLLLQKKEQTCQTYKMFKLANDKGLKESGFLADYAYTSSQCASLKEAKEKQDLFNVANTLYKAATQTSNQRLLAYVYHSWAKSHILQKDLIKAQEMVDLSKSFGGSIDSSLLQSLKDHS